MINFENLQVRNPDKKMLNILGLGFFMGYYQETFDGQHFLKNN